MSSPRFAFAGDRDISVRVLEFLLDQDCQPLALILPEKGRATHDHMLLEMCSFPDHCNILRGKQFREAEGLALLRTLDLDFLIGVHFPYIVPQNVLDTPRVGVLNLHPAYLPYTRGWHTPSWSILENCPYGATLHFMDSGVDTGDIIHQKQLATTVADTANSLYKRAKDLEVEVFKEAWPDIQNNTYTRTPQLSDVGSTHRRKDLFRKEVQCLTLNVPVLTGDLLQRLRALTTNCIDEAAYFDEGGRRHRVQVVITEEKTAPSHNNRALPKAATDKDEKGDCAPKTLNNREPGKHIGSTTNRIYLSPPHMSSKARTLLLDAFDSNWIAPLGPHVDMLEEEFAEKTGAARAVALSSGTAALHLALLALGVGPDDEVVTSTLTFAATANAIRYVGATPVFIDSDEETWNMDPRRLDEALEEAQKRGHPPKAVITVDLYGQCCDYGSILDVCRRHEVPVIEDAAEALGAAYRGKAAGNFGTVGCFSFNGNKIITASSGGMLVSRQKDIADRIRHLATQARDPAVHYQHSEIGYNYRMSNLLAAVTRGQLEVLDDRVDKRRANFRFYEERLGELPGVGFMPEIAGGRSTRWLSCLTIDPERFGATREDIRLALEAENIESRPVWKPMHMQPVFADCRVHGGGVARRLFERGLCLPSGSDLAEEDLRRIVDIVCSVCHSETRA